jgi:hypothetical protein
MALSSLAPELLDEVINYCMPDGFESLVLSCKALYAYCQPKIPLHNRLSKRWKHATNEFPRHHDTLRILLEIVKEPLVARYIYHLNLWDLQQPISIGNDPEARFRDDETTMQKIKDLIMESPLSRYLALADIDPDDWWSQLFIPRTERHRNIPRYSYRRDYEPAKMNEEYAFIALLFLLPNLQSLTPFREWCHINMDDTNHHAAQYIYPVLDALVKHSNASNSPGLPLSKLETLYPSCLQRFDQRTAFQNLQWFLQLPSVTTMYASSCSNESVTSYLPFSWRMASIPSNVTRLELSYCDMDVEDISTLLSNTPRLQVFKYGHQYIGGPGLLPPWSPQLFVETIAKNCGPTLTELAVTLHSGANIEHGVQDFLVFTKLKKLEIDLLVLFGPSKESGRVRFCRGREVPEGTCRWQMAELPCLASILPESLERIDFNFTDAGPAMLALLTDFTEERAARLPALKKVIFRQWIDTQSHWEGPETERDLVEAEGCDFEVYTVVPALEHWERSRQNMALWVREFQEKVELETNIGRSPPPPELRMSFP